MTPGPLLLVSGSRTLAAHPRAQVWARDTVGCRVVVYCLDGTVRDGALVVLGRWAAADQIPERGDDEWRRWPLRRNTAMVRAVANRQRETPGRQASVLALVDPLSATHGTTHTARVAEQWGLHVTRETWRDPVGA